MSPRISPLSGERKTMWTQFHGIHERLYGQNQHRIKVLELMGKMNEEQEAAVKVLDEAIRKAADRGSDGITLKEAEKALKHIRNAQQYEARLQPKHKSAEQDGNSIRSMFTQLGEYMAEAFGDESPKLARVAP